MKNKGSVDSLILIVCLPCVAFVLVITLLGIIKPVLATLGSSVYHASDSSPYQRLPLKPTPTSTSQKPKKSSIALPQSPLRATEPLGETVLLVVRSHQRSGRNAAYSVRVE